MEAVTLWFHKFLNHPRWQAMMSRWGFLDAFVLIFLLLGILYGIKKGLLRICVEILQLIFIFWLVYGNYKTVSHLVKHNLPLFPWNSADALSYFFLLAAVWAAVLMIDGSLQKWVRADTWAPLRAAGGAVFGLLHIGLVLSMLVNGLMLLPIKPLREFFGYGDSNAAPFVLRLAPEIYEYILRILEAGVQVFWK